MTPFTSQTLRVESRVFDRADIVLEGLEQAGPSYEARVFLNNPSADEHTERSASNGYAGSVHIYGTGGPAPDSGAPARLPMTRHLIATDALRRALAERPEIVVTVVPVSPTGPPENFRLKDVTVVLDPSFS